MTTRILHIKEDTHLKLKVYAAQNKMTMSEAIDNMIEQQKKQKIIYQQWEAVADHDKKLLRLAGFNPADER